MFAKGLPNQRGTVYPRPFGRSIRGPKQLRIQHYLDGFHTVEDSPQSNPQSTDPPQRTISIDKFELHGTIPANRERVIDLTIPTDRNEIFLRFFIVPVPSVAGGRS